uniref:Uncharacterized protein n=1 Tax=Candidatus Phytoplasma australasiaticum subsp. australasiaticum TaxID=2832407 RepID=A0A7S7FZL0_9MOLU|nr:hypothetical protein H7685_00995 ['Parthenium hysterophorus' phyllody phytoplasma]
MELAKFLNIDINVLRKQYKLIKMFPFDDEFKLMITIYKDKNKYFTIVKGAGEILLDLSYYICINNTKIMLLKMQNIKTNLNFN